MDLAAADRSDSLDACFLRERLRDCALGLRDCAAEEAKEAIDLRELADTMLAAE